MEYLLSSPSPSGRHRWVSAGPGVVSRESVDAAIAPGAVIDPNRGRVGGDRIDPATAPSGTPLGDAGYRSTTPPVQILLDVTAGPDAGHRRVLAPGLWTFGGSVDADVAVVGGGLPPVAAVVLVGDDGTVEIRRSAAVDSGDADPMFGSPTEGRSQVGRPTTGDPVVCRIGPHRLEFRSWRQPPTRCGPDGAVSVAVRRPRPVPVVAPVPTVPAPPERRRSRSLPLSSALLPAASGIGMAWLFDNPRFLLLALFAPTAILGIGIGTRLWAGRRFAGECRRYRRDVAALLPAVAAAGADAAVVADRHHPSVARLAADLSTLGDLRWTRPAGDAAHLVVRLGHARYVEPIAAIPAEGDEALRHEVAAAVGAASAATGNVPVLVSLVDEGGLAIVGHPARTRPLAQAVVAQLVALVPPSELRVSVCASPGASAAWSWVRRVGHATPDSVLTWPDAIERHVDSAGPDDGVTHVLVVDDGAYLDARLLERVAGRRGVRVVWLGPSALSPPASCTSWVVLDADGATLHASRWRPSAPGPQHFVPEAADRDLVESVADQLVGRRDGRGDGAATVPSIVGIDELDLPAPTGSAERRGAPRHLSIPIGVGAAGPVAVDLVGDGPHTLVCGTTGSGKSELLATLVLGLATRYRPDEVSVAFLDCKGGALAGRLQDLPHVVGVVSDLDAVSGARALRSLRAELRDRMALLDGVADDIDEFARIDPDRCPPRLVIVVDEFAVLAREFPAVLSDLIDLARRGRSLGLHLVLATQRPAGVVSDQILSNVGLRIVLRMVDGADARAVCASAVPATFPADTPGRALVVSSGPPTVVQCATVRVASAHATGGASVALVGVTTPPGAPATGDVTDAGHPAVEQTAGAPRFDAALATVRSIVSAHAGARRPRALWMAPPPQHLAWTSLAPRVAADGSDLDANAVRVGVIDPDDARSQPLATLDLGPGRSLLFVGGPGRGRTTTVATALADVIASRRPGEAEVFVASTDPAERVAWAAIPHVVCVADAADPTALTRLVDAVADDESARSWVVDAAGTSPPATGTVRPPRRFLVIDGFGAARSSLETAAGLTWWHRLRRLLEDGDPSVTALLADRRRGALPPSILAAVDTVVDHGATATADGARPLGAEFTSRQPAGWVCLDDGTRSKVAVVSGSDEVDARHDAVAALRALADLGAVHGDRARPRSLGFVDDPGTVPTAWRNAWRPVVGLDERGRPLGLDLASDDVLVVGSSKSGRSSAIALLIDQLAELASTVRIDRIAGAHRATTDRVRDLAQSATCADGVESIVVIDDADHLDIEASPHLARLVSRRDIRVIAVVDVRAVGRTLTGWLPDLRRAGQCLHLMPRDGAEVESVTGQRHRPRPGTMPHPGRGVLAQSGRVTPIQLFRPS